MRNVVLLLALLGVLLVQITHAQPPPDESWLTVQVSTRDDSPLPGTPRVIARPLAGGAPLTAKLLENPGSVLVFFGIAPGEYELQLTLTNSGLPVLTRVERVTPGPNALIWQLPEKVAVSGALTLGGKAVTPQQYYGFLMGEKDRKPLAISVEVSEGRYTLPGMFPGRYRVMLLSELGYGTAEFVISEERDEPFEQPLILQSGGRISFTVLDTLQTPVSKAAITLTYLTQVEGWRMNIALPLTTGAAGLVCSVPLPPGRWRWAVTHEQHQGSSGVEMVTETGMKNVQAILRKR